MQSLKLFLEQIQLDQYYTSFLTAGATEHDLPQLIALNEQELAELANALNMLPFHYIKLKKSLREFKSIASSQEFVVPEEDTPLPCTKEFIVQHATIYGKKKNRSLTSYEEAINRASIQVALQNPLLISKKGELFDLAKKQLLQDGYQYKRGSSRSKLQQDTAEPTKRKKSPQDSSLILQKRQENAHIMSIKRLEKIEQLTRQVDDIIQYRQTTEKDLNENEYNNLTRLAMEADLIRYEQDKIKLNKEISRLKAQERKHQWYKRRKSSLSSTSSDRSSSSDSSYTMSEQQQTMYPTSAFSIYATSSHVRNAVISK